MKGRREITEEEEEVRGQGISNEVEELSDGPMEGSKSLQREDGVEELSPITIPYIFTTLCNRAASSSMALSEAISQHGTTSTALYTTGSCLLYSRMTSFAALYLSHPTPKLSNLYQLLHTILYSLRLTRACLNLLLKVV